MPTLPFCVVPTPLGTISGVNSGGADVAGQPFSNAGEFDTIGMVWGRAGQGAGGTVDISCDLGAFYSIDFVSMIWGNAQPTTAYSFLLADTQAHIVSGPATYQSASTSFISPSITRRDGLYSSHLELPSPVSARFWRLAITTVPDPFTLSAIIIGKKITPANWYSPGFKYGVKDLGSLNVGNYGVPDLAPGRKLRTLDFTLGWQSESDFETLFRPLAEQIGTTSPAFWCFDPTANTYRQARSYLGWLQDPVVAQHAANTPGGPRFTQDFSILSMI